ncbi:hypothetical protein CRG98_043186 [Punica granatum]|uniref:DDE Tnp4 domain-containing protein n=1 Tax=Punica granatum TaxID=22663 RepID=A0A2I0HXG6_PUNGR|nr:hypothetical protein CRG98_043186 [Punica granatum]
MTDTAAHVPRGKRINFVLAAVTDSLSEFGRRSCLLPCDFGVGCDSGLRFSSEDMASSKGLKKRRKTEKKAEAIGSDSGSSSQPVDWWDEFCRRVNDDCSPPKVLDTFESAFRISRKTFGYICSLIKEDFAAKPGNFVFKDGTLLSLYDQVAISLRRLGSGESLGAIGDSFGLTHSNVAQITWRFVEAMEKRALHHLQWPNSGTDTDRIKSKFEKLSGLPNCCGAIDITHILMNLRASDPTIKLCRDHAKNQSMVLQAIVGPNMRFLDIVTGWPGKMSESSIFQNSNFYRLCKEGKRLNEKIGEYIVGDSGYPLLPFLITPYEGTELSESSIKFNKRHLEVALVAQRALKRLKDNWGIIRGVMWRPDRHKLPRIILVCCLLHNIAIDLEDEVQIELPACSSNHDPGYRQQHGDCLVCLPAKQPAALSTQ